MSFICDRSSTTSKNPIAEEVRNNLVVKSLISPCPNIEAICLEKTLGSSLRVLVVGVKIPPKRSLVIFQYLVDSVESVLIYKVFPHILIGGDLNLPSSSHTTGSEDLLNDLLNNYGLTQYNMIKDPNGAIIDLTFSDIPCLVKVPRNV